MRQAVKFVNKQACTLKMIGYFLYSFIICVVLVFSTKMSARIGSKTQRYNIAQRDHLIQYMESHSMFAAGKFCGKEGKDGLRHRWDALAQELNSISGGAQKDSSQWQTVWRDLKHKVSKRVSEIRTEQQRSTGNKERKHRPLTPHELRVAGIIGPEYVQGSSTCPDSIPETEMKLERLEKGDESVLDEAPLVLTVSFVDSQRNEEVQESNQTLYELRDVEFTSNDLNEVNSNEANITPSAEAGPSSATTPASEGLTPSSKKKTIKGTRKASRLRIGTQLQEARTRFQDLCASNNRSMEMLAQATMKQADAATVQAQAALLHAKNEAEQVRIFSRLTDVLESALEKLKWGLG